VVGGRWKVEVGQGFGNLPELFGNIVGCPFLIHGNIIPYFLVEDYMVNKLPDNEILVEVAERYGFEVGELALLRDLLNPIYTVNVAGRPSFLRFRAMQDYVHGLFALAAGSEDEWLSEFLARQRYIIENEVAFSNIDFH
jgi:hypothetical protein